MQVHLEEVLVGMAVQVGAACLALVAVLETRQVYRHHRAAMAAQGLIQEVAAAAAAVAQPQLAQLEQRQSAATAATAQHLAFLAGLLLMLVEAAAVHGLRAVVLPQDQAAAEVAALVD